MSVRRTQSLKSYSGPQHRVSFNKDVHVKRYGKKSLPVVEEESDQDMRGRADGKEDVSTMPTEKRSNNVNSTATTTTPVVGSNGGLAKRIKEFFTQKRRKKPEEKARDVHEIDDELSARYRQYKGDSANYDTTKRRGSAPETKPSWFRSLDRADNKRSGRGTQSHLRYFDETDITKNHSSSKPGIRKSYLDLPSQDETDLESVTTGRNRHVSSTPQPRYGSLVYLHAPQVRDIPPNFRRDDESSLTDGNYTKKRHLTRSVSLVGPWSPIHKPTNYHHKVRETGTQTIERRKKTIPIMVNDSPYSTVINEKKTSNNFTQNHNKRGQLRELVFTGPSLNSRGPAEWKGRL